MNTIAATYAFGTAVTWGLVMQLQRRGVATIDGRTGALIVVLSFAGFFWLLAPFLIEWRWFLHDATLLFVLSGLLVPGFAQICLMLSVEKLGPSLTSVVGTFAPVFAIAPAVLFLGEPLNLQAAVGILLMIGGVILSIQANSTRAGSFALVLIWLPILSAAARGFGQPVSKHGLNALPEPFFATLVMITTATIFIGATHVSRRRDTIQFQFGPNVLWLVVAGVLLGVSFLFLYAALNIGDVILVAPITSTMPIWVVVFDHFIFKHERIGWWHMAAAVAVSIGTIVLIMR